MSFDTSSIPNDAEITKAWLTVTKHSIDGDPWADPAGNELVIDLKTGCLGPSCGVEKENWDANDTVSATASIEKFTNGSQDSSNFDYAGRAMINKDGKTQLRLRFTKVQNFSNFTTIHGGGSSNLAVLHVMIKEV